MSKPPTFVPPMSFRLSKSGTVSESSIENAFDVIPDTKYVKVSDWSWNVISMNKGRICKYNIMVNYDTSNDKYVVEPRIEMGDKYLMANMVGKIRAHLTGTKDPDIFGVAQLKTGIDLPELTDVEADEAIKPILYMLNDASVCNQSLALEIFCDMSYESYMQRHMVRNGCYNEVARFCNSSDIKQKILAHKIQVNRYMFEVIIDK